MVLERIDAKRREAQRRTEEDERAKLILGDIYKDLDSQLRNKSIENYRFRIIKGTLMGETGPIGVTFTGDHGTVFNIKDNTPFSRITVTFQGTHEFYELKPADKNNDSEFLHVSESGDVKKIGFSDATYLRERIVDPILNPQPPTVS